VSGAKWIYNQIDPPSTIDDSSEADSDNDETINALDDDSDYYNDDYWNGNEDEIEAGVCHEQNN
jgi:hypothetical protein